MHATIHGVAVCSAGIVTASDLQLAQPVVEEPLTHQVRARVTECSALLLLLFAEPAALDQTSRQIQLAVYYPLVVPNNLI